MYVYIYIYICIDTLISSISLKGFVILFFWNALAARPTSGSSLQVVFNVRNKDFGYGYNAATKAWLSWKMFRKYLYIPVVPHKAVAEVSE